MCRCVLYCLEEVPSPLSLSARHMLWGRQGAHAQWGIMHLLGGGCVKSMRTCGCGLD